MLMEANPSRFTSLTRPFKFQEFWLLDSSFPGVVAQAWSRGEGLGERIDNFSKDALIWNKNLFGNIHLKKRRVMARIYGVQKALASRPSADLINLEKVLHQYLELLLDQEHDLWALKSRINWMIQGDRNTSFYHVSTIARRKRNHIAAAKDDVGNWLTEDRQVMDFFRRGFVELYTTSHSSAPQVASISDQWRA